MTEHSLKNIDCSYLKTDKTDFLKTLEHTVSMQAVVSDGWFASCLTSVTGLVSWGYIVISPQLNFFICKIQVLTIIKLTVIIIPFSQSFCED